MCSWFPVSLAVFQFIRFKQVDLVLPWFFRSAFFASSCPSLCSCLVTPRLFLSILHPSSPRQLMKVWFTPFVNAHPIARAFIPPSPPVPLTLSVVSPDLSAHCPPPPFPPPPRGGGVQGVTPSSSHIRHVFQPTLCIECSFGVVYEILSKISMGSTAEQAVARCPPAAQFNSRWSRTNAKRQQRKRDVRGDPTAPGHSLAQKRQSARTVGIRQSILLYPSSSSNSSKPTTSRTTLF